MTEVEIKVRYQETDAQGRVYHSNYFVWYDVARTEYLRQHDCSYKELEKQGVFFVVTEVKNKYIRGLEFDDLIAVKVALVRVGAASFELEYDVVDKKTNEIVSKGWTKLAVVDKFGKVIKIPSEILEKIK